MTVVFTIAARDLILMAVDSVETRLFSASVEFDKVTKLFSFPGVGCVATWGARQGNKIGTFLNSQMHISTKMHGVDDLAELVFEYLIEQYQPHKDNLEDVGYHVAGFDRNGNARLYHIFWGIDRPASREELFQGYKKQDHSPSEDRVQFLYNGRNDLAEAVIYTLIDQLKRDQLVNFRLGAQPDRIRFGFFVLRFAAELTPEVGPPFKVSLISPRNQIEQLIRQDFNPLDTNTAMEVLSKLHY